MITYLLKLSLSDWKDIASILSAIFASLLIIKGTYELHLQGKQKRTEFFVTMHNRLIENPTLGMITEMLERERIEDKGQGGGAGTGLAKLSIKEKSAFLHFLEEVALMTQSKLLRKDVAHYMFGYYAITCWKSNNFWSNMNREGDYWELFRKFQAEMAKIDSNKPFPVSRFAF